MEIPCPKCNNDMRIISRTELGNAVVEITLFCYKCQRIDSLYQEDFLEMKGKQMTAESRYYTILNDAEIEERIKKLSSGQALKFAEAEAKGIERRQALFVASSYPKEEK